MLRSRLKLCLRAALASLLVAVCSAAALAPGTATAYEPRVPDSFFGSMPIRRGCLACSPGAGRANSTQLNTINGAGIDWIRSNVSWSEIEPAPPVAGLHLYNWLSLDGYVAALARHDLTM